jgi:hypothetical protein
VDGSGDVFVTGSSYNGSSDDYVTINYSNAGVTLWTNRYNRPVEQQRCADAPPSGLVALCDIFPPLVQAFYRVRVE